MAYKLDLDAVKNAYESIPVGRRTVLTALAGAGLYALGRDVVPKLFQSKPVTAKESASPLTPTNEQIAKGLVEKLNAYAKTKKIPDNEIVTFGYFDGNSGIKRDAIYDRNNRNFQVLTSFQDKTFQFTQDLGNDGSVDHAANFSYVNDVKAGMTPQTTQGLSNYALANAVHVGDIPKRAQDELQKKHRKDMELITKELEIQLIKMALR